MEPITPEKRAELARILQRQGVPNDETDSFIEKLQAGWSIGAAEVECWVCQGLGVEVIQTGMGSRTVTCRKCFGLGRAHRFVVIENKVSE